jgi:hypothetical protein
VIYHDVADRTFEIVGAPVDVDERHELLLLLCREAAVMFTATGSPTQALVDAVKTALASPTPRSARW